MFLSGRDSIFSFAHDFKTGYKPFGLLSPVKSRRKENMAYTSSICAIIPTYNRAGYIRETIDSILNQTRPVQEIIVVNDGSTDDTVAVVEAYGTRVRLISKENGGKASALNRALAVTRADYIWICDDDDIADPHAMEHLAGALDADPAAGMAYGRYDIFEDIDGRRVIHKSTYWARPEEPNDRINFLEGMFTNQFAMLVRRCIYEKTGPFREDMIRSQDFEMTTRIVRHTKTVCIPHTIFYYREHQGVRGATADKFAAGDNRRKWLEYEQKIIRTVIQTYNLDEFTPTFARGADSHDQRAAALIQRACIAANRALWAEAAADIRAASQTGAACGPDIMILGERVIRSVLPWIVLSQNPQDIRALRRCGKESSFGKNFLQSLCRPLIWHARHAFQTKDIGGGIRILGLAIGILGIGGTTRRICTSLFCS